MQLNALYALLPNFLKTVTKSVGALKYASKQVWIQKLNKLVTKAKQILTLLPFNCRKERWPVWLQQFLWLHCLVRRLLCFATSRKHGPAALSCDAFSSLLFVVNVPPVSCCCAAATGWRAQARPEENSPHSLCGSFVVLRPLCFVNTALLEWLTSVAGFEPFEHRGLCWIGPFSYEYLTSWEFCHGMRIWEFY